MISPHRSRERILTYGMMGCGKTSGAWHIIERLDQDNDARVIYIETDNTVDEFLDSRDINLGGVSEGDTVTGSLGTGTMDILRPRDWAGYVGALEYAWEAAEKDDWVIVDNATWLWEGVQRWYVESAYGMKIEEFLLQQRKQQIKSNKGNHTAMEGLFTDWGAINPTYEYHVRRRFMLPPCHLYVTANLKTLGAQDKQDAQKRGMYGAQGSMPAGQKHLGHDVRTVLLMEKDKNGYTITTVKDRERSEVNAYPWENFVKDYLVDVGGWDDVGGNHSSGSHNGTGGKRVLKMKGR